MPSHYDQEVDLLEQFRRAFIQGGLALPSALKNLLKPPQITHGGGRLPLPGRPGGVNPSGGLFEMIAAIPGVADMLANNLLRGIEQTGGYPEGFFRGSDEKIQASTPRLPEIPDIPAPSPRPEKDATPSGVRAGASQLRRRLQNLPTGTETTRRGPKIF